MIKFFQSKVIQAALITGVFGLIVAYSQQTSRSYAPPEINSSPGGILIQGDNNVVVADKEFLGIREPLGLYRDGKKVGIVLDHDISINEKENIFSFDELQFDKPIPNGDISYLSLPFEFGKYIIRIDSTEEVTLIFPPGAKGIKGRILGVRMQ